MSLVTAGSAGFLCDHYAHSQRNATVDVDADVQRWIHGEANNGWHIGNAIIGLLIQYAMSENADTTIRPRLTVTYKLAPHREALATDTCGIHTPCRALHNPP